MPKTLADLTPAERAECVGMWCEIDDIPEPKIIAWVRTTQAGIMFPDYIGEIEACPHEEVTPLPDLPRAWSPDGTPPRGECEPTE